MKRKLQKEPQESKNVLAAETWTLSFSVSQFLLSLYSQTASKVPIHSAEISADLQLIRSSRKEAKPYF